MAAKKTNRRSAGGQRTPSELAASLDRFDRAKVAVIGDVMLDRYSYGDVGRISPEAPIPVFRHRRTVAMLGGAGNVARNIAALGGRATVVGLIGGDDAGREIRALIAGERGVRGKLIANRNHATTVKTRFVAGHQQLLRCDDESDGAPERVLTRGVLAATRSAVARAGAVILSDYGKGVVLADVAAAAIAAARKRGVPVIVDPKGADWSRYKGASLVTPNRPELEEAAGRALSGDDEIVAAARALIRRYSLDAVLVTRSAEGMTAVTATTADHLPAQAREVFDVSGAGDTVVAGIAVGLASGLTLRDAAEVANAAAGIVVGKLGTAVAYRPEVFAALHGAEIAGAERKVANLASAVDRVALWRRQGLKVGFTNGCFDLLHPGHLHLLRQARAACDRLVVGLNTDASVQRLKGPTRPVQSESARAAVLSSLTDVDLVVPFDDDTPMKLIHGLKPDVLVKGADYTIKTVVGASFVQGYGGRVVLADLKPGHSTTATVARMGRS
ncbi:MAG TPA: D-glycero-beta-D-manno-heptose-7-phosphate kinase [Alphaproteobacteria bacterium]|jgi:D-beta-D-heptose 7-phosphate kinase/D-beta-D-heptose 1-phosphate adenosyltransferase|nr:D-glycero-beta-D-manno-heptose-7-phosphate kinase [Alphaproteobacteria bacterium]